ncbi:hypothetical protein [Spongiimicrobium salis]|uniref:hypothetical protein n=1 Tax=Spongiimicrobium salis TaxID=1667022 RepID=UPI00374DD93E
MRKSIFIISTLLIISCQKSAVGECVAFEKDGELFTIEIFDAENSQGFTDRDFYLQVATREELRQAALDSPCNNNN